ncbi:DUF3025 domain-containing protein [Catenovulum sp. 2E275]|uniref:DUF3025 domain-containing protein n=1 Tax=Catenovulum sp. 2E275 TaxID=2980497 RepID=UPI0021D1C48A|nr:DUF3025 domain-containing protein [Catenovulum sp. 2E275]MCU4674542.1 DUF3025 domain-containing protein [Catenovulum sp. 2E275]
MKRKYQADQIWDANLFNQNPIFSDLSACLNLAEFNIFPNCKQIQQGLFKPEFSDNQYLAPYQFIAQTEDFDWQGLSYESLIFEQKTIPTRVANWHDLFNACIWHLFPQTKTLLNHLHMADIAQFGAKQRTKQRDAITLFDECGVVIAYQDDAQKLALQAHLWVDIFWQQRASWFKKIRPFIFGHAMYEMSLNPFVGLTAKAYFIRVDEAFFKQSLAKQYQLLDGLLAADIKHNHTLVNNRSLSPLPLLGIPGWSDENNQLSYYQNTDYFRPKRQPNNKAS